MSLEISLPSGETVIGRVNTNVFMANGNVQIPSTGAAYRSRAFYCNTHLLTV